MIILFTGPRRIADEWMVLSASHTLLYLGAKGEAALPEGVTAVSSVTDIPPDLIIDLHLRSTRARIDRLRALLAGSSADVPVLCNTAAVTITELAARCGGDAAGRMTGMAALAGMSAAPLVELCVPHGRESAVAPIIGEFLASIDREAVLVADEIGMVYPRIAALIINEAVYAHQCGVATREDIDTAMMLGVNHPIGPFALAGRIGWRHVHILLTALHAELGDDRYRPATLLKKLAIT